MINVIFEDRYENEKVIGIAASQREATFLIMDFLKEHNYQSHYQRLWEDGNDIKIDVGSHSEFFILRSDKGEKLEVKEYIKKY